ncbi:MAG TPA: lipid-binding SYLF domain-containing protein [Paludibaculum sp.]
MTRTFLALSLSAAYLAAEKNEPAEAIKRVEASTRVMEEIMASPDKGIPKDLLDKAHCVVVVPGLKTGGFIVGAKYGKGVVACRKDGGGWRGPATVRVEGGSVGFQIGAGEVDTVLLIMNASGAEKLRRSEFKIGGEAAAMAGPVGRAAQAETDAYMRAEILGYSRSRGVFAGVAITGSTLREDLGDNAVIYGRRLSNLEILEDARGTPPAPAKTLLATLDSYSRWEKK